MYNPKSKKAAEFIDHAEVMATLAYAEQNKDNLALIDGILEKAKERKGLSHREAALLLDCNDEEKNREIYALAEQIKKDFYGNRIVMFAPLYLSNYCINGCVYCPYHLKNKHITRKKLTQEEVAREVVALQDMGHKRLAVEAGEDPVPQSHRIYFECIDTIYHVMIKTAPFAGQWSISRRRRWKTTASSGDANIGTYILFQETYHKESYEGSIPPA